MLHKVIVALGYNMRTWVLGGYTGHEEWKPIRRARNVTVFDAVHMYTE